MHLDYGSYRLFDLELGLIEGVTGRLVLGNGSTSGISRGLCYPDSLIYFPYRIYEIDDCLLGMLTPPWHLIPPLIYSVYV
jgi:hypothetical protein